MLTSCDVGPARRKGTPKQQDWAPRHRDKRYEVSNTMLGSAPEPAHLPLAEARADRVLGHCYAKKGMFREAEAAFREFTPRVPPSASTRIAYVLALSGKKQE